MLIGGYTGTKNACLHCALGDVLDTHASLEGIPVLEPSSGI